MPTPWAAPIVGHGHGKGLSKGHAGGQWNGGWGAHIRARDKSLCTAQWLEYRMGVGAEGTQMRAGDTVWEQRWHKWGTAP